MKVLKLGGSVITNKRELLDAGSRASQKTGPTFHSPVCRRLLREVRDSREQVIIVTGAGSFGHIKAKKYHIDTGYTDDSQWDGYVEVHRDVRRLNLMVLDEAVRLGMRVVSIPPSVSVLQNDGKIHYLDEGVFRRYLEQGITPMTFGDVCLDMSPRRFSICGGDYLVSYLSRIFGAKRAIFVSDIDGIFVGPPKALAPEFTVKDLARIYPMKNLQGEDATGGIKKKAQLALNSSASGTEVGLVNGKKKGRLLEALKGGNPTGTWFRRA